MKKLNVHKVLDMGMIAVAFGLAAYNQPRTSERLATHWNTLGEADGFSGKFEGLWLLPLLMLGLYALFAVLPRLDPHYGNIKKFEKQWRQFVTIFLAFLLYLYALMLWWNAGNSFVFTRPFMAGLAVFMIGLSRLIGSAEPNFTIGIRTPWTLSSARVWKQTHWLGGRLYMGVAFVLLLGIIWPRQAAWFTLASVGGVSLYLVVYSYVLWTKTRSP